MTQTARTTSVTDDSDLSAPAGADTLIGVLEEVAGLGYATQQIGRGDASIECTACDREFPGAAFCVEVVRRLEGASDAADMLLVACSKCPGCYQPGVLTLGYGPNTSEHDTEILKVLDLSVADPASSPAARG